jgi:23S rRNA pseudouridine1911/1915/1917 synthase
MQDRVSEEQVGQRLDVFVAAKLPRLSRAFVRKLCEDSRVLVNDEARKPGHKLHEGDKVKVDFDEAELDNIPEIDLPVLYEDDDCIVINKPVGVLTHALGVHGTEPSVASFLRGKLSRVHPWNGERAGIVHRLDRATSGVIIGAKNQPALSMLQKQFSQRKVKKTYIAVVEGHPEPAEAIIDMPIERNPKAPSTFRVGPNGKPAQTRYKVLKEGKTRSLVELKPETGRTHQLRVHLAKAGHPIIGDPLYGKGKYGDRLFLHALSLEITLPGGERRTFSAPLPEEFEETVG